VSTLLLTLLPLALGAAVSPTLLMVEVFALSASTSPIIKGWLVALGATAALIVYAALGLLAGSALPHSHPHHAIDAAIDLTAAVLLGWLIIHQLSSRGAASSKPSLAQRLDAASGRTFFIAGFVMMVTNFSTIILFMPAIRIITKAQVALSGRGLALILVMLIALLPVLAPVSVVTILGDRASVALAKLNDVVTRRSLAITITLEAIFCAFFLIKGITELTAS